MSYNLRGRCRLPATMLTIVVAIANTLGGRPVSAQDTEQSKVNWNRYDQLLSEYSQQLKDSRLTIEQLTKRVGELESAKSTQNWAATTNRLNQIFPITSSAIIDDDALHIAEDFQDRLDELEETVFDLDERVGSRGVVKVFDADSLDIGGLMTQTYTAALGESESDDSFSQTQLELLIRAQLNEKWSLFSALGFLREADLDFSDPARPSFRSVANRTPQIIAWTNYKHSDLLQLQLGRFVTPHGIINIEHFPPTLLEINQPQFLRPFSGATLFPNFVQGAHVHGRKFVGEDETDLLQYNFYVGMFSAGDPEDLTFGGRLSYAQTESGWTAGFNYSHGTRSQGAADAPLGNFTVVPATSLTGNDYDQIGVDVLCDQEQWLWKTELFYSFEHHEDNRYAFYTQPALRVTDKHILFYRFDMLKPGQGLSRSTEHVVGINYLPIPTVRCRLAYFLKEFKATDTIANILQASVTVSF